MDFSNIFIRNYPSSSFDLASAIWSDQGTDFKKTIVSLKKQMVSTHGNWVDCINQSAMALHVGHPTVWTWMVKANKSRCIAALLQEGFPADTPIYHDGVWIPAPIFAYQHDFALNEFSRLNVFLTNSIHWNGAALLKHAANQLCSSVFQKETQFSAAILQKWATEAAGQRIEGMNQPLWVSATQHQVVEQTQSLESPWMRYSPQSVPVKIPLGWALVLCGHQDLANVFLSQGWEPYASLPLIEGRHIEACTWSLAAKNWWKTQSSACRIETEPGVWLHGPRFSSTHATSS